MRSAPTTSAATSPLAARAKRAPVRVRVSAPTCRTAKTPIRVQGATEKAAATWGTAKSRLVLRRPRPRIALPDFSRTACAATLRATGRARLAASTSKSPASAMVSAGTRSPGRIRGRRARRTLSSRVSTTARATATEAVGFTAPALHAVPPRVWARARRAACAMVWARAAQRFKASNAARTRAARGPVATRAVRSTPTAGRFTSARAARAWPIGAPPAMATPSSGRPASGLRAAFISAPAPRVSRAATAISTARTAQTALPLGHAHASGRPRRTNRTDARWRGARSAAARTAMPLRRASST